jgi:hypothetical protein
VERFPRNRIVSVAALTTPAVQTVVSPNNDTAYTVAWLDLTSGPIVINVPDSGGRFYTFQFLDAFTNAFSYLGTGSTGTKAGAYALVPPGWRGSLPAGVIRIAAPSNTVWLLGRTLVNGAADLGAVKRLVARDQATPLNEWTTGARQAAIVLDQYPHTAQQTIPTGARFVAALNQELKVDRPPAADDCALRAMAPAGVQVPHPSRAQILIDDTSAVPPPLPSVASDPLANQAIAAGTAAGTQIIATGGNVLNAHSRKTNNGWEVLGNWVGHYGRDYIGRAIVTRQLLGANTPQQAIYPLADTDITGRALNGSRRYTIRFAKGKLPPARVFWSLTMYTASSFLYANEINRYAIGDRTRGLHFARDGSLTIYIQHGAPASPAARANWLPGPAGNFHLALRLYQPKPAALDGAWKPAPVERAGGR